MQDGRFEPLPELQPGRLLRLPLVLSYLGNIGKTSLYEGIKRGVYPSPRKLGGGRTSVWLSDDVISLIQKVV